MSEGSCHRLQDRRRRQGNDFRDDRQFRASRDVPLQTRLAARITTTLQLTSHLRQPKMRFQSLFLASILASISLVAGDALQKWTEIASKSRSNVLRLDETTFDQLITPERNYTSISTSYQMWKLIILVALTALQPQYQCALCREFDPEFATVAESWRRAHPQSDGVFFGKVDFPEGRPIFVRVIVSYCERC